MLNLKTLKLALSIIALAMTLCLISEFGIRLFCFKNNVLSYPKIKSVKYLGQTNFLKKSKHKDLVYELKENITGFHNMVPFNTNSQGLRDTEHKFTKNANTYRVAIVGDSYSIPSGVNIENSYHKVLEKN